MALFSKNYPEEIAKRIPPASGWSRDGRCFTTGRFRGSTRRSGTRVFGVVENRYTLTYRSSAHCRSGVTADMHCVTGWRRRQRMGGRAVPGTGGAGEAEAGRRVGDHPLRLRLHLEPLPAGDDGRRRAGGVGPRGTAAGAGARVSPSPGGSEAVRVEEREVAARAWSSSPRTSAGSGRSGGTTRTPSRGARSGTRTRRVLGRSRSPSPTDPRRGSGVPAARASPPIRRSTAATRTVPQGGCNGTPARLASSPTDVKIATPNAGATDATPMPGRSMRDAHPPPLKANTPRRSTTHAASWMGGGARGGAPTWMPSASGPKIRWTPGPRERPTPGGSR